MDRKLKTFALSIALAMAVGCSQPSQKVTLFDQWLANARGHSVDTKLVEEIRENREALEPQFIEAFNNGPDAARLEEVETSVEQEWSLAQVQLAEPDVYGLDKEDIAEMQSLSLATEKRRALERSEHNFKVTALRGLGITRGREAQAMLAQIAADQSSPFRAIAAEVLASIKGS